MPRNKFLTRLARQQRRSPVWEVRDDPIEKQTDFNPEFRQGAPEQLATFPNRIAHRIDSLPSAIAPDQMTVGTALSIYRENHAPHTVDPARIEYAISALNRFWQNYLVNDVRGEICRRYMSSRGVSTGTVRRELGCLNAALSYCVREGYLTSAPTVWLPKRPPAKDLWLTRDQVASLLRRAPRHLRRFILIAVYTGTRKDAILRLQWRPNTEGGYVDLESGILYRASNSATATKKRQPPAKIPRQLHAHLRRWKRLSREYVIEYKGHPVRSIKRSWRTAAEPGVTPHTLRHSAITWAMQRGVRLTDAAGYFGVSIDTLEQVYLHHHPSYQESAVSAMERKI